MRTHAQRFLSLVLLALIVLAVMAGVVGVSNAQPLGSITVRELIPANGSTVPAGQAVTVSAFIESDISIDTNSVSASLDGSPLVVQLVVGSRAERVGFNATSTFTPGAHTLRVTATNTNGERAEAQSIFTAVQATAAPTAVPSVVATPIPPVQLPRTGGIPVDLVSLALLSLGVAAAGLSLRRRSR